MGGVAGHMSHLHEDLNLSFNDLISIINKVAQAEIKPVEKVDGQNIFLSVDRFGQPKAARNVGDIKKGGMTPADYAKKWEGHPAENAFMNGFKAITLALNSMSVEEKIAIFGGGNRYVNMEIMYPANPNIINYGASYVVVHELQTFEKTGTRVVTGDEAQAFEFLKQKVNAAEIAIDNETWKVYGPQVIPLNNIANSVPHQNAIAKITEIADSAGGTNSTIGDYSKIIFSEMCKAAGLDEVTIDGLIDIAYGDHDKAARSLKLKELKKSAPSHAKIISSFGTKVNSKKVILSSLTSLERIISDFAIAVLRGVKSFFAVDHDKAVSEMRAELELSIQQLQSVAEAGDEKMAGLLEKQLEKLANIENVASSLEGIVFEVNGKIYKMTGAFAMVNQLIGRARRLPKAAVKESILRKFIRKVLKGFTF